MPPTNTAKNKTNNYIRALHIFVSFRSACCRKRRHRQRQRQQNGHNAVNYVLLVSGALLMDVFYKEDIINSWIRAAR